MPEIINKKMKFPDTIQELKNTRNIYENKNKIVIESVGFQVSIEQQMKEDGIENVESYSLGNKDKRTRLSLLTNFIKEGIIVFPREGADLLIDQILDFGSTKHDDVVDAFTLACLYFINEYKHKEYNIFTIS